MAVTVTRYPQAMLKGVNTPWTEDFHLDEELFVGQVRRLVDEGYEHLYVFGTAGEGHAVSDPLFRRVVDVFAEATNSPSLHPQVGIITLSPGHAKERIAHGISRGIRVFQIALPSWGVLAPDEKIGFLVDLCGAFPDASFLHYNYPRAVNLMSPGDYERAIDAVPNLVATKNSTMDMSTIRGLMTKAGELQHFFLQGPFPYACLYGECSLISSLGPVFPQLSRQLFEAGRRGDVEAAFRIQQRMIEVAAGLYAGVDRLHVDGAYDKLTSWLVDPEFPLRLLPPFEPISQEAAATARRYFETECSDLA